eukprot:scaffold27960_cov57-Phaeocystis_antarctica.AAC.1
MRARSARVGTAHWRAGKRAGYGPTARGTGAAPLTYGQARHACCSHSAHRSLVVILEGNVSSRRA